MSEHFKFKPLTKYRKAVSEHNITVSEQLTSNFVEARPKGNFHVDSFTQQWQQENNVRVVEGNSNRFVNVDKFEQFARSLRSDQIIPREQFDSDAQYIRGNAKELMNNFMSSPALSRVSRENFNADSHRQGATLFTSTVGYSDIQRIFNGLGDKEQNLIKDIASEMLAHKLGLNVLAKEDLKATGYEQNLTKDELETIKSNFELQERFLIADNNGLNFNPVLNYDTYYNQYGEKNNKSVQSIIDLAEAYVAAYEVVHNRNIDLVVQKEQELEQRSRDQFAEQIRSQPDAPFNQYPAINKILNINDEVADIDKILMSHDNRENTVLLSEKEIKTLLEQKDQAAATLRQIHNEANIYDFALRGPTEKSGDKFYVNFNEEFTRKDLSLQSYSTEDKEPSERDKETRALINQVESYWEKNNVTDPRMIDTSCLKDRKISYDESKTISVKLPHYGKPIELISTQFVKDLNISPLQPQVTMVKKFEQFLDYKALHPKVSQPQVDKRLVASSLEHGDKCTQIQNICKGMAQFAISRNYSNQLYSSPEEKQLTAAIAGSMMAKAFASEDPMSTRLQNRFNASLSQEAADILAKVPRQERFELFNRAHEQAKIVKEHLMAPYREQTQQVQEQKQPTLMQQAKEILQTRVVDKAKELVQAIKEQFKSQSKDIKSQGLNR